MRRLELRKYFPVYSQEKLLRYAFAFDGVISGAIFRGRFCEGDVLEGDDLTFSSISSSSNDASVGMLSFLMLMLTADRCRKFGDCERLGLWNNNKFKL